MKKRYLLNLSLLLIIAFVINSCRKDKEIKQIPNIPIIPNDNCANAYDSRCKPYDNLYMGTIATQCTFSPFTIFLDKYVYWHTCVNPNNPNEIVYLRREIGVQQGNDFDMFKFNFCTGENTLLTNHVAYSPNWSVKNWIIFTGKDLQLWKIKSNGDSLIQLTNTGNYNNEAKWNTNGTKYIYFDVSLGNSILAVSNENGVILNTFPNVGSITGWLDSLNILNTSNNNLMKTNVLSNNTEIFTPIIGRGYLEYDAKHQLLLGLKDSILFLKNFIFDLKTNSVNDIGQWNDQSNIRNAHLGLNNKFLIHLILKDTLTADPCKLNFRSHIAIMNIDGTNLKQVIFPE